MYPVQNTHVIYCLNGSLRPSQNMFTSKCTVNMENIVCISINRNSRQVRRKTLEHGFAVIYCIILCNSAELQSPFPRFHRFSMLFVSVSILDTNHVTYRRGASSAVVIGSLMDFPETTCTGTAAVCRIKTVTY